MAKEKTHNPVVKHSHGGVEHEHKAGGRHIHDGQDVEYRDADGKVVEPRKR